MLLGEVVARSFVARRAYRMAGIVVTIFGNAACYTVSQNS